MCNSCATMTCAPSRPSCACFAIVSCKFPGGGKLAAEQHCAIDTCCKAKQYFRNFGTMLHKMGVSGSQTVVRARLCQSAVFSWHTLLIRLHRFLACLNKPTQSCVGPSRPPPSLEVIPRICPPHAPAAPQTPAVRCMVLRGRRLDGWMFGRSSHPAI